MKNVKLGIVGLGAIGQLHLKHGSKLANAEIVAAADTSKPALSGEDFRRKEYYRLQ
jgi:predicted dehydrogenase